MLDRFERVTFTVWAEDETLLYMNRLMCEWANRPLGEVLGKGLRELFPEWADDLSGVMQEVLSTKKPVYRRATNDVPNPVTGKIEHWETDYFYLEMPDGRRAVGTRGVNSTDKVEAERKLHEERRKLKDIIMAAPVAMALFEGPDHRLTMMNWNYEKLYGGRVKVGMSPRFDVSPDDPETKKHVALLDEIWRTKEPFIANEMPILYDWLGTGQPQEKVFHIVYQPTFSATGNVNGIAVFGVDVTESVHSRRHAESAVRLRDEYMSVASHELRTPLTSILLQAELLRPMCAVDSRATAGIDRIKKHGLRINEMVGTLLDVSRISHGEVPLELEEIDMGTVTKDVLHKLRPDIEKAECEVIQNIAPTVGEWDRARVEQVITNLITNALKYGKGGPIFVSAHQVGGKAVLSVRDFGIGIRSEDKERIFEQFQRVAPKEFASGLGLGLWIVHKIVSALGGSINVDSAPGEGSTFTVALPVKNRTKT